MKRALFICALAGVALFACKKENKTVTVNETIHDTINQVIPLNGNVNPDTLTSGISVVFGTKVAATFPSASTTAGAPLLDTLYRRTYQTAAGGFLILQPQALDGHISGYYVQVAGSQSHFKVTYPVIPPPRKAAGASHREVTGNVNATIVINMPADITGDTFYVKYAAYDENNLVSAPVTATVVVLPQGNAAFNKALAGTWKYYGYKDYYPGHYNEAFTIDTFAENGSAYYACNDNKLTEVAAATDKQLVNSASTLDWTFTFGKNAFSNVQLYGYATLDLDNSTCDKQVYTYNPADDYRVDGFVSYDAFTNRLTLINSQSASSISLSYITYYVIELSEHRLVLSDVYNYGNNDAQTQTFYQFYK